MSRGNVVQIILTLEDLARLKRQAVKEKLAPAALGRVLLLQGLAERRVTALVMASQKEKPRP